MQVSERVERKMFELLAGRANLRYGYRPGVIFHLAGRVSVIRSIQLSWRWKCKILIERGARVVVRGSGRIISSPGSMVVIGFEPDLRAATAISIAHGGSLSVDGTISILRGSMISVGPLGSLSLGSGLLLNEGGRIICHHEVTIGADCQIGYGATISDTDEHEVLDVETASGRAYRTHEAVVAPVVLADHTWIGARSIVLKGTSIGERAVVGAGSVVTHDVGAGELVVGVPARPLRRNITWLP